MSPKVRGFVLLAHVVSSVGWLGLNLAVPALAVTGMTTGSPATQHAVYRVLDMLGGFYLIPLSVTAFVTGVVLSLGTSWGIFRHYWVTVKFVLTSIAVVLIPLSLLPGLRETAEVVARHTSRRVRRRRQGRGGPGRRRIRLHHHVPHLRDRVDLQAVGTHRVRQAAARRVLPPPVDRVSRRGPGSARCPRERTRPAGRTPDGVFRRSTGGRRRRPRDRPGSIGGLGLAGVNDVTGTDHGDSPSTTGR
ncbi:hypothetical protein FE391_46865 [Nonomuraea sp. KC401]|uniref:hypothetical protein n=1 Tax=unclassified Nonomuraea TaxID=2593643 RepID=UPI0010FDEBA4|nr:MULTISPECIES: hypothetical protein [unclassified Nonomuraea]NBE99265.1 hypothetical protein [Nonomuraea sp. K271]TLF45102.1 hypothetical protein FE391_46865 [Nonomuraea sp. KC401]